VIKIVKFKYPLRAMLVMNTYKPAALVLGFTALSGMSTLPFIPQQTAAPHYVSVNRHQVEVKQTSNVFGTVTYVTFQDPRNASKKVTVSFDPNENYRRIEVVGPRVLGHIKYHVACQDGAQRCIIKPEDSYGDIALIGKGPALEIRSVKRSLSSMILQMKL
jgi:hypothetical protein